MSTWGAMVQRIEDETARENVDADAIKKAICSAIKYYRSHRFWFNEGEIPITTVDGTAAYTLGTLIGSGTYPNWAMIEIDTARLLHNSVYHALRHLPVATFRSTFSSTTLEGMPSHYTWYDDQIFFGPIPDDAYTVYLAGVADVGSPDYTYNGSAWAFNVGTSADGVATAITDDFTNSWFVKGEALIRARAKAILYGDYLGNSQRAAEQYNLALDEYNALKRTSDLRAMPDRVIPYSL
jgi:hypothetical protein